MWRVGWRFGGGGGGGGVWGGGGLLKCISKEKLGDITGVICDPL